MAETKPTSARRYEAELDRLAHLKLEATHPQGRRELHREAEETGFVIPAFVTIDMVNRLIDRIKRV